MQPAPNLRGKVDSRYYEGVNSCVFKIPLSQAPSFWLKTSFIRNLFVFLVILFRGASQPKAISCSSKEKTKVELGLHHGSVTEIGWLFSQWCRYIGQLLNICTSWCWDPGNNFSNLKVFLKTHTFCLILTKILFVNMRWSFMLIEGMTFELSVQLSILLFVLASQI